MVNEKGLLLQCYVFATRMFFKKMFSGADVRSRTQVRGVASGLERGRDIARMLHADSSGRRSRRKRDLHVTMLCYRTVYRGEASEEYIM